MVATLFLVHFVNFWDKQVVGLAAPSLIAEFQLSVAEYGLLTGAFFALYGIGGIAVAVVAAPRWRPRNILAVLLLFWSLLQLPIVLASSFHVLIVCRILLGLSEGAGAPTALNSAHAWFDDRSRDLPSAIVLFGATVGSLVAAPTLSLVMIEFGWRAAFLLCGALGFAVLLLWLVIGKEGPFEAERKADEDRQTPARVRALDVARDPTILGNLVIGSCAYCMTGFAVGWLPLFLGKLAGDQTRAAWLFSAMLAFQAFVILALPLTSQRLLRRGVTSRRARGWMMATCMLLSGAAFLTAAVVSAIGWKLAALAVAIGLPAAVFPISAAMISETTPSSHRNAVVTIIFAAITIPVMFTSFGTGWLVSVTNWAVVLNVYGIIMLVGAAAGYAMLHPEKSIQRFAALDAQ